MGIEKLEEVSSFLRDKSFKFKKSNFSGISLSCLKKKINVVVAGATGYVGLRFSIILSKHPKVNSLNLCAKKNIGKKINFFDKRIKKKFPKYPVKKNVIGKKIDIVFLSSAKWGGSKTNKKYIRIIKNLRFIDLSADFRIQNAKNIKNIINKNIKQKDSLKNQLYSIAELSSERIKILE